MTKLILNKYMSKKITFETEEEKASAIAEEKVQHPTPTEYQAKHLVDLENAVVEK